MVDRRGNEVQSDQMKADDRGTEGTSGPFRAYLQKILPIKPVHKKLPFPEVPFIFQFFTRLAAVFAGVGLWGSELLSVQSA